VIFAFFFTAHQPFSGTCIEKTLEVLSAVHCRV